jgi:hypothetical protein
MSHSDSFAAEKSSLTIQEVAMTGKKKAPHQQVAVKVSRKTVAAMREFAKVYNNFKMCPLLHDLLRVIFPNSVAKNKRRLLQRTVERYRKFQEAHKELGLPELILRKGKDGAMIGVPPGVLEQLAEFRIDPKKVQKAKGLIVTAAQFGAPLNESVWLSFKRYADHMGYVLVVMPIKYGPVMTKFQQELNKRVLTSTFDERLHGHMVFEDTVLANGMLNLNTMRLRPTLVKFISAAVGQRGYNVSQIFASPKLELMHLQRLMHDYPKVAMTTGAVTHPSYNVDNLGQQDRTGAIAAAEHTYAGVVLEFSSAKTFHIRPLLSNKEGEFYDIDPVNGGAIFVTPDKIEHRPDGVNAAYLGDVHVGKTHPDVREVTFGDGQMLQTLRPKHVILGDLFDGHSISHWDDLNASRRALKGEANQNSLEAELKLVVSELEYMHRQLPKAELDVIAANHNEILKRFLQSMRWASDDTNLAFCARLFADLHDDLVTRKVPINEAEAQDPIKFWIDRHAPFAKTFERQDILLLPENDDAVKIACSFHGDVGPSGVGRTSMDAMREWNQWSIIGHMHSAAILGPIWRVGTMTGLTEHYVNGPRTKWTHTHAIIFENGQRQLINIVNGAWHGQSKKRPKSAGIKKPGEAPKKRAKKRAAKKH